MNRPEDLIYCIYTSGTTGKPKGVMIEHRNVVNYVSESDKSVMAHAYANGYRKFASVTNLVFDIFVTEAILTLCHGMTTYVANREQQNDLQQFGKLVEENGIEILQTTPSRIKGMFAQDPDTKAFSGMKFIMLGSEAVGADIVRKLKASSGAAVENVYGPSETTVWSTCLMIDKDYQSIPVGRPISNTQIYVMQGDLACGIGIPGELCIAGDGVARGYLNRPELTAEKFTANPFGEGRMYHTGDLARWLPDGNVEYLGRIDDQVKVRGFRIELGEIESRLRELDGVKDCAVIAREDASGDKAIHAYVVGDGEISASRVREALGKVLPEYMVPQYVMQIEAIPMTRNGKLDRRALPEIEVGITKEYVAPRNKTEEVICECFGEILGIERVGIRDSFFELGGHSLRATRLVNRIEAETGCRIALKQVFGSPTPEKLAELVTGSKAEEYTTIPRAEEKEYYPMSSGQRRMFLLHQIESGSTTYNMPQAIGFSGRLDYNRVLRSFKETIERHEVLRTRLLVHNDELVQQVCKSFSVDVREIDLIGKNNDEIENEFNSFVEPFDFSCPPLVRMALGHKDDGDVLFIDMHHIASDGNSISIFLRDFSLYYNKGAFDVPALQYKDYSEWYRNIDYSKQERYWKEQLQCVPVLDMPLDFTRPKEQSFAGNIIFGEINKDLKCKMQRLCKNLGITEYMLLLSGIMITLSKYSNQDDIVIGSPIAGRTNISMDTMMGMFINTLVMRGRPSAEKTVSDFLFEMKDTSLKAYENQEYPFERLVETIDVERNISRNPLFDVLFTYHNFEKNDFQLDGINGTYLPYGQHKTAKMDLNFSIGSEDNGYYIALEYCTAIFKESTVVSLLERVTHVIEQIVDSPYMKISDIEIVFEEEKRKFLGSSIERPKSDEVATCVHRLFEGQALTTPNDIAAISEGKSITYKELNARSNQLSGYLRNEGLVSGDIVSLYFDKSIDTLTAVFGVLKSGCTYIPLDTNYPKERISSMIVLSKSKAILTLSKYKGELSDVTNVKIIAIDELAKEIDGYSKENNSLAVDPEQIMYIIFTSGSTGTPKGVAVRHRNYYYYLKGIINSLGINEPLSFALVSTFAADLGSTNIFVPLVTGGKVHMISYERATDPEELASYFRDNEIDAMKLVPSHFEALQVLEHPEEIIPRKKIIFAGEACKYDVVAKVRELRPECEIYNNYGPTETTVSVLSYRVPDEIEVNSAIVPLGRPIDGVRAYILDANKKLVPEGVYGELYIGGPTVSSGYINDSLQNEKSFIKNPFDDKDDYPLYKTGDKVRWLPNGVIDILGRMDRQIKIRGYRIDPEGIEEIINGYSQVQNSVVTQKTDRNNDSRLVAYVVLRDKESDSDLQSIKAHLKTVVPDYMVPSVWIQIESLPITENGKLDYAGLPEINNADINQGEEHILPRTEAEKRVVEAFKSILGVEKVGIDDSFFDLGGESFKAIKTVKQIDPSLKVIQLFKNPTPRQLALCLEVSDHESMEGYVYELTKEDGRQKKVNLICVPYGGGQAIAFQSLADCLPEDYALYSVQVPGRDIKGGDSEPMPLYDLARACVDEIKNKVNGPIAILGHCIGGALAMQIALLLEEEKLGLIGVFEEANFPTPRLPGRFFEIWNRLFPADKFVANRLLKESLKAIGNLDDGDNEEQGILLKNMRFDTREAEDFYTRTLNYTPGFKKLSVPICCIMGERDRTTTFYQERYREWEDFSDNVSLKEIPDAGHFFQKHQAGILSKCIVDQLEDWRKDKDEAREQKPYKEADAKADVKNTRVTPSLRIMILVAMGQIISLLGSSMSSLALGIWVMGETIDITPYRNISIIVLLPALLAAPFAGPLVDRVDRRKVMIISDCIAAMGTILVSIMLFTGNVNIWFIYLSSMLSSFAGAFQRPAYLAAIAQITPKRYLGRVNGFVQMGEAASTFMAPMLAGVLIMTIDIKGILIIDLATFIISTTVLLLVRFPNSMFQRQEESFAKEFVGGWKFIIKRKSMRLMVIFFLFVNFFMAAVTFLYEPILLSFADASTMGLVLAAQSLGMIVAGLVISIWGGCESRAKGMVGFVILAGISSVLFGLRPSALLTTVAMFICGMSATLVNTHWQILIQSKVGMELQGRVFSINIMLASLLSPIAVYFAGVLSKSYFNPLMEEDQPANQFLQVIVGSGEGRGMALLCVIFGFMLILWGIIGMSWKSLVNMDVILPDATPGAVISGDKDKLQEAMDNALNETQKH